MLTCIRCGRPVCMKCSEETEVGRICNYCLTHKPEDPVEQKVNNEYRATDDILGFTISLVAGICVTSSLISVGYFIVYIKLRISFGLGFIFMILSAISSYFANNIRRIIISRKPKYLSLTSSTGMILGAIFGGIITSLIFRINLLVAIIIASVLGVILAFAEYKDLL